MRQRDQVGCRFALDQVFVQDTIPSFEGDSTIPCALGINDDPRSSLADPEASRLGAEDVSQTMGFEVGFDLVPEDLSLFAGTAIRSDADEEVPGCRLQAGFLQGAIHALLLVGNRSPGDEKSFHLRGSE